MKIKRILTIVSALSIVFVLATAKAINAATELARTRALRQRLQDYLFTHLDHLEGEAIHILREVAGQCERPALLFSGGKDSVVLLRLAEKAFRPGRFPFPLLHIDTGHNYPEVIAFRDRRASELGETLRVRTLDASIAQGRVRLKLYLDPGGDRPSPASPAQAAR